MDTREVSVAGRPGRPEGTQQMISRNTHLGVPVATHIGASCCLDGALSNSPNHPLNEEQAEELGNGGQGNVGQHSVVGLERLH